MFNNLTSQLDYNTALNSNNYISKNINTTENLRARVAKTVEEKKHRAKC